MADRLSEIEKRFAGVAFPGACRAEDTEWLIADDRRLRLVLRDVLTDLDQSERYEGRAIQIRDALGLCVTTGCNNQRSNSEGWEEYCVECIDDD